MIPVLYPASATDFSSFGLGVLTDTISCEVTEERNGIFECLLKYPVSGQHYGLITKECIIKAKPNDTAADQAFRIYRITKPLNGIVTIYGQHISYDLANVPVLPFSTESRSPQLILSQLLAGDTRFTGWTDYSDAKAFSVIQPKSVRACLGGTEGSMLSKWYGEFEWDNFTVKFHSHRGEKTGVVIEYGKNLTAMEQDEDNSGVYTALLPYAVYTPEGSDIETVVTLPEVTLPIVTSEIVRAKTLIMDFSDQFDGVVTEEALRAKANSYIKTNPLGATIPTVKVSFEPLWKQPEYSALLERVNLCDTVTIRHSLLGVSVSAMVIETVYDTLAERYVSISLGQSKSSMITTISEVQSTVDKVESAVGRFPKLLQTAIGKATGLITGQSGGYVVIHTSEENGQPYELLILDAPSIDEAVMSGGGMWAAWDFPVTATTAPTKPPSRRTVRSLQTSSLPALWWRTLSRQVLSSRRTARPGGTWRAARLCFVPTPPARRSPRSATALPPLRSRKCSDWSSSHPTGTSSRTVM